ncbi:MAG: (2Fe-2S)-binding protein [Candidatus Zixiibacteriota bacterium]
MKIRFILNKMPTDIDTDPSRRLVDVLREDYGLIGVKEGCGEGECGACTVIMDKRPVPSCLVPVGNIQKTRILTIEGIRDGEGFKAIEKAFEEAGAVQCGFCTPGFIMTIYALLKVNAMPDDETIRKALSGNLCRCTGYNMIIDAVKLAAEKIKGLKRW